MMIEDKKYLNELREQLKDITEEKSIVDKKIYGALSYKIRNESAEGLKELLSIIKDNNDECGEDIIGSILALHNAFMLFEANECPKLAKRMLVIMSMISTISEATDKYVEIKIREGKSRAGKGKTSRHKEAALTIAKNTWSVYPNASLAGMASEIYVHLHQQWVDTPEMETIKRWLKAEKIAPEFKLKNKNFKLVINKEG